MEKLASLLTDLCPPMPIANWRGRTVHKASRSLIVINVEHLDKCFCFLMNRQGITRTLRGITGYKS